MEERAFSPPTQRLLDEAKRVGAVVDFVRFSITEAEAATGFDGPSDAAHMLGREAMLRAMNALGKRNDARLQANGVEPGRGFRLRIDGEPVGRHVSLDTLMGPSWSWSLARAGVRGALLGEASMAERATFEAEYRHWFIARGLEHDDCGLRGLAGAFFEPPYGLSTGRVEARQRTAVGSRDIVLEYPSKADLARLFEELVTDLFLGFEAPVLVYEYPDDWSNYFDAGREWWGTFCWTAMLPEFREIVAISASATD